MDDDYAAHATAEEWPLPVWLHNARQHVCADGKRQARDPEERCVSLWLVYPRKLLCCLKVRSQKCNPKERDMSVWLLGSGQLLRSELSRTWPSECPAHAYIDMYLAKAQLLLSPLERPFHPE